MKRFWTRPEWYWNFGQNALPQVEETTVYLQYAPAAWEGMTALFVSDIHLGPFAGREFARSLAEVIRGVDAQILLLGGDYSEEGELLKFFFECMAKIAFPLGKFAVLGNNDSECAEKDHLDFCKEAEKGGIRILKNEQAELHFQGGRILLGGIDECKWGRPDAKHLFKDAGENDGRILLSHYPMSLRNKKMFGDIKPEVILSGHTHGGQFNLAGFTPYSLGYEAKYRGLSHVKGWRGKELVSSGIGCSKFPIRIGTRPMIHRIRFEKADSEHVSGVRSFS